MPRPAGNAFRHGKRKADVRKDDFDESFLSDDDDAPEELTADQLRALKRFKAGGDDDDDDSPSASSEEDEGDGGGAGPAVPHRRDEDDDQVEEAAGGEGSDDEDIESEDDDEDEDDDDDDDDSEGDDERTLEEQVADVPFEVLETLRQDGRGLVGQAARVAAAKAAARSFKRDNKDRPQEMSSKRPVGRFREVIQVPHKGHLDPRFDTTHGAASKDGFRHRYAFLYNDMLPQEKKELQAKIKKEKNPKFKAKLQAQLQRVDAALRDEDLRRRTHKLETEWKTKERGAVTAGKNPYFLKASDKKRLTLLAKYQELKEHGKLDKFMEKRRKKNATKDHRYLPSGRRQLE